MEDILETYFGHKPEEAEDQDQESMPRQLCKPQYFSATSNPLNRDAIAKAHLSWLGSHGVGESIGKPVRHLDLLYF
jgi:hypothetical protein